MKKNDQKDFSIVELLASVIISIGKNFIILVKKYETQLDNMIMAAKSSS